ncbi:hypothetical protein IAU60_003663 [Kwoniella sp. DSM 27419]
MNPRTLLSGPSRLRPFASALAQANASVSSRRYLLTFPHADLDPSKGSTKLVIRTFDGIPSMVHAFAIIRAVEAKLGVSVLDLIVPKDTDSLKYTPTIFLTTVRPVKLDGPLLLEIPSPQLSSESNFLGGPSLADIQSVLSPSHEAISTSNITQSPAGGKDAPLQFRVELQRRPALIQRRNSQTRRKRYKQDGQEGIEIVQQLKEFGNGFYGGFEGLAQKFEHIKLRSETAQDTATSSSNKLSDWSSKRGEAPVETERAERPVEESEEAAVDVQEVQQEFEPVTPVEETVAPAVSAATVARAAVTSAPSDDAGQTSQTPSKAQQARDRLRESAVAAARRDLEMKAKKAKDVASQAALEEQRQQEAQARLREDEERERIEKETADKESGNAGIFGSVFGKK